MHKLVTVKIAPDNYDHFGVAEHLEWYLNNGWRIESVTPVSTSVASGMNQKELLEGSAWLAVVLNNE
ncbi:MAG: hypothetical protein QF408_07710 [Pirellulales bacterium]|jgi:hypothetical protein|nr:hypothetical protein [Pirellulales bacterium]|tara:strand:- start:344 stop:544 length:201 start_codon:yes stop_codon:yes gene_type:complete